MQAGFSRTRRRDLGVSGARCSLGIPSLTGQCWSRGGPCVLTAGTCRGDCPSRGPRWVPGAAAGLALPPCWTMNPRGYGWPAFSWVALRVSPYCWGPTHTAHVLTRLLGSSMVALRGWPWLPRLGRQPPSLECRPRPPRVCLVASGWFRKVLVQTRGRGCPLFSGRVCVRRVFSSECLADFPGARHLGLDISLREVFFFFF